jgi:hypothetical protein
MNRVHYFVACSLLATALVSIVQASCPDEGVAIVECPAKGAYDSTCTGTTQAACESDVIEQAQQEEWGKLYAPNSYVIERIGENKLCYTSFNCKFDTDKEECDRDNDSADEHERRINRSFNCYQ